MNHRTSKYPISAQFLARWSPRALTGEPISDEDLFSLFEAARWSPSSYNGQPWRFIYAKRDSIEWGHLFGLLVEFNQSWVKNAAVLVCIISKNTFDHNGKPSITHSFDTGAAWMALALEAHHRNLVAHGMQGFDYDRARKDLNIPEDHTVEAMCAIGKQAAAEILPPGLREKEIPSDRRPLEEIMMHGTFQAISKKPKTTQ